MTTTSTTSLPAWFRRWNQAPTAAGAWITVRLPANERTTLISVQRAWTELMATLPRANVAGKERWLELRRQYAATRDSKLLAELEAAGPRGTTLTEQLRVRSHTIKDGARRIAAAQGCRPIYQHVFSLAAAIVLDRIKSEEKDERKMCAETRLEFRPSEHLWGLANLTAFYQTEAECYAAEPVDATFLAPPAIALRDLWPNILKEGKK